MREPVREKGIALLMVLWVLILLSAIATEFCFAMRTEVNMVRNFKEQTTAYYIALAGLNSAVKELVRNEAKPKKKRLLKDDEEETDGADETSNGWRMNTNIPPVPFGDGAFKVHIGNEAGKINLNTAKEPLLKMMLNQFDLDEQEKNIIVDSIMDWRDENDLHRMNGAENDYYQSLKEPYECKNGDFDTVEELLLVRGVTPEIFYGGIKSMVSVFQDRGSKIKKTRRLSRKATGSKICINAATEPMLRSLPKMTEESVQLIMDFRKDADFKSLGEVQTLLGADIYAAISSHITIDKSSYYEISSVGGVKDSPTRQAVSMIVEIDPSSKTRFRIAQWNDRTAISESPVAEP